MFKNKLGFYTQVSQGVHERITAIKPPVILMHAWDQGLLEEIRRFRSPETFVVGRMDYVRIDGKQTPVADLVKGWLTEGDPEAHGRFFAEHILEDNFRLAQRAEGGRRLVDAWMSLNECIPGPGSDSYLAGTPQDRQKIEDKYRAYDRFQFAFRNRLMEQGIEAVAFNFAAGNFGSAEHYASFFPLTLGTYTYLGFHEYGWPALSPHLHPDAASSAGAYSPIVRTLRQTQGRDYRVIITELGLARMYRHPKDAAGDVGWLYPGETIDQEAYRRSLEWYNEQLNQDDFVLGACLFQVGHEGKWTTFRHIGQDNEGRPITILDWVEAMAAAGRGGGDDRGAEDTMAGMIGIDANSPIHDDGNLAGQVADPGIIADAGVGWVRLNFKLGPWQSVHDQTRHAGRSWEETYRGIVDGYRQRGLRIYGLISYEAVKVSGQDINTIFRGQPGNARTHPWIDGYAETCVDILKIFGNSLSAVEILNEPDGYWGGSTNLVHPHWFAILLDRIYHEVRRRPEFNHIQIVSGPVEGTAGNNNAGARDYLPKVYAFAKDHLDWGAGRPFPFDGIGYHLYIEEEMNRDWLPHREAIRATYTRYLNEMRNSIRASGDRPNKPLYISEMGWYTNKGPEQRQAECLPFALEMLLRGSWHVALAVVFCTQDFGPQESNHPRWYGLYRQGPLGENTRKPAFEVVKGFCRRSREDAGPAPIQPAPAAPSAPVTPGLAGVTNQDVINAFGAVIQASNLTGWKLMADNGLSLGALARAAGQPYGGPHPAAMPRLNDEQRAMLTDLLARAGSDTRGAGGGFLIGLPKLTVGIEQLPAEFQISLRLAASPIERKAARAWNRWSALLAAIAGEIEISPAAAAAFLALAARYPLTDRQGRLTIRFDVEDFLRRSQAAADDLALHFRTDPARPWRQQYWRPDAESAWRKVHAGQREEWAALRQALQFDRAAAYAATAMGMAGLMGFNHPLLGYASAEQMFLSLASSQRMQVLALFDLMATPGRNSQALRALRRHDFETFAAVFAGVEAAPRWAAEMAAAVDFCTRRDPLAPG